MVGQTRKMSALEIAINYAIGIVLAFIVQCLLMEAYGIGFSVGRDFSITLIFTLVSVVRSYAVRRLFNHLHVRNAQ